ncbi:hypothetical protein B0H67DRAFT_548848 [Lasiosphaeris hirsuta]|uniref:Uncharacterized protein n=1 Tax=Lasiosphaeris hirsuta TaxID=260670 RepID=A0AA40EAE7_9PEZI|nr:hypothetical protein B0H67DRAFT_548848 [Lasiosphaeris hirsuta]
MARQSPIKFSSPPAIPLDSLILVTGANGLIASHPPRRGRFLLVKAPDLATPGAWTEALQDDVAGVACIAGSVNLHLADHEVDAEVQQVLRAFFNLLEAAKAHPSVRSFAFNSFIWAAVTPEAGVHETVTEDTWNERY